MVEHERIVARRGELGMSQAELARRVGISQPAIVEIEKGRVQSTRYVIEIARALDISPKEVDPRYEGPAVQTGFDYHGDLPVFSINPRDGRSEISSAPINAVARPAALQHVPGAYALLIFSDEMAPEFEPGDSLLVNPHLPALGGYSYVFRGPDGTSNAIVRRMLATTDRNWSVRTWNSAQGFADEEISLTDWPYCHRIIGKYSRG